MDTLTPKKIAFLFDFSGARSSQVFEEYSKDRVLELYSSSIWMTEVFEYRQNSTSNLSFIDEESEQNVQKVSKLVMNEKNNVRGIFVTHIRVQIFLYIQVIP